MAEEKKIRVLIVEDQALIRELIQAILEEAGYDIVGKTEDGPQALALAETLHPDVILMDIELKTMDGLEATQKIQTTCPTPVVILTGHEMPGLIERASHAGAGAYLVKPPKIHELRGAITIAMARFADMMALKQVEAQLSQARDELEARVQERTNAYLATNERLQQEITEHQQTEEALRKAHEQLEKRVTQRTEELEKTNKTLRAEIAERERAEQALREAHERLNATLNALPDLLFEVDRHGHIYDFRGPRSEKNFIPPEEFLGQTVEHVFPKDAAATIMHAIEQAATLGQVTGAVYTLETPVLAGWFELSIAAKGDPQTPEGRLVVLIRDITERVHAEQTLKESETRYRLTIDAMSDIIHVVDRNLKFILANTTLKQRCLALGLSNNAIGQTIFDVFPFLPTSVRDEYEQVFESGTMLVTEETSFVANQEIATETRKIPIMEGERVTSVLTVIHDITQRKEAEKVLKESEERLRMVVQNMPVMMDAFDEKGTLIVWNRESERVTGYSADEMVHKPDALSALCPDPAYRKKVQAGLIHPRHDFRNTEWDFTCKDGIIRTVAWSNISKQFPIPGWNSWGIGVDVTQRKRAEESLKARLAMEELTAAISTRFINVSIEKFEEEITRTLQEVGEFIGGDHSYIRLFNEDKRTFRQEFDWYRSGTSPQNAKNHKALSHWSLEKLTRREPLSITAIAELPPEAAEEQALLKSQKICSRLAIPLVINNQLSGLFGVDVLQAEKSWTEENIRLLKLVGDVFINALARRQAETALHQRHLELELFSRLSQALATTLDLDQVLFTLLEEVQRLLGVVACSVWLIEPDSDTLVCRQATGAQNEYVRGWRMPVGEGLVGWVARRGESLVVPDVDADQRHFKGVDQQTQLPLRSILSIPLRVKQHVIGVIQIVDTQVNRFSTADLKLIEPLAATAAITIENARLYEQAQLDAKTKAMLLDESNHRVKNNLAAILGILALELQQPYKEAADFRASLRDLQSRIQGMTTVHNMLSDAQWSPLAIDKLVAEIIHVALSGSPIRHKIKVVVTPPDEPILIAPKQATGLAIIVNELTTNSIKYAFRERNEGYIRVKITKEPQDDQATLQFRDDGPGWPEDVLCGQRENVGLYLIKLNVRSPLRGQFTLQNDAGAVATIQFKLAPLTPPKA